MGGKTNPALHFSQAVPGKSEKYEIRISKPGPRPKGGDSEGEILNKFEFPKI